MAPSKAALDLNAMISEDRQRRKNETLAKEIFGNRRASAPGGLNKRNNSKPTAAPSLASRIGPIGGGVVKRTISTSTRPAASRPIARPAGNVDAEWTHDLHTLNNPPASKFSQGPPRGPKAAARTNRNERIYSALHNAASSPALNSQFNIVGTAKPAPGISIRGLAGPSMVMIKNLALGTTVADIESAMTPVGGNVLNCRIISEKPKVIAELVFETKEGADNVVDTFNNQNADGHLLQVYHKSGALPANLKQAAAASPAPRSNTPQGPRADRNTDRSEGYSDTDRYAPRERSRERRRDYGREDVMDGSYGFNDDRMDTDEGGNGGLYSDNLLSSRGRGFANNRDRGGRGDRNRSYR